MLCRLLKNPVFTLLLGASVAFVSCSSPVTVIPEAMNHISGSADGTEFTATNVQGVLDTTGIYIVTATINSDASLSLYFIDQNVETHPVQTGGALLEFIHQLDSLIDIEPPIQDSLILDSLGAGLIDILASEDDVLGDDRCFAFYFIGDFIYFSENGSFRLTNYDPELYRLTGELNMGLINFNGGRKVFQADFDDVQIIPTE